MLYCFVLNIYSHEMNYDGSVYQMCSEYNYDPKFAA
jgi:hypothetical protein